MENNISSNPKFKYDVKLVFNNDTCESVKTFDTEEEALAELTKQVQLQEGVMKFKIDRIDNTSGKTVEWLTTEKRF